MLNPTLVLFGEQIGSVKTEIEGIVAERVAGQFRD
jgi:hypothetical protein